MMAKITYKQLKQLCICKRDLQKFKNYFGSEVIVTVDRAIEVGEYFDFSTLATLTLCGDFLRKFDDACSSFRKTYEANLFPKWGNYKQQYIFLFTKKNFTEKQYDIALEALRTRFEAELTLIERPYWRLCAPVWAKLYRKQQEAIQ
jgi:hypothetical protein